MTPAAAEILALQVLGYIAADPRLLQGLQETTGLDAGTLRGSADSTEVLSGVLGFLMGDEKLLLRFCDSEGLDPHLPGRALSVITGEPLNY